METIYGLKFNRFDVIDHEEKPELKTERFKDIFTGEVSINIRAYYNGKRDVWALMSSDDADLLEDFDSICKEFNEEFEWKPFYEEALRLCAEHYQRNIERETEKLAKLEIKIKNLEENKND
ncbi:hypothetical protein ABQE17_13650 [Enterococcus gallinarum]|uniref:hypothetical protein n=1 Tax=Enterococcus gallinarum TaxID=1353 RepID=UPI0032E39FFF